MANLKPDNLRKRLMPDLHQQIVDLEADIEDLSDAAGRCQKIIAVAKASVGAGFLVLLVILTGVLRFEPMLFVFGVAAILGGIAVYGTNKSTLDEIRAGIKSREEARMKIINELELLTVEGL